MYMFACIYTYAYMHVLLYEGALQPSLSHDSKANLRTEVQIRFRIHFGDVYVPWIPAL